MGDDDDVYINHPYIIKKLKKKNGEANATSTTTTSILTTATTTISLEQKVETNVGELSKNKKMILLPIYQCNS